MGMFDGMGGGFFGSGASNAEESDQNVTSPWQTGDIENGFVLDLGVISNYGKYSRTDIDLTMTDYGAIDQAFEFAGQNMDDVLTFAGGAMSRALDSSDAARIDSLEFGAGAMQAAFAEAEAARQESARAQAQAQAAIAHAQSEANAMVRENTAQSIAAVRASSVDAMQFGAGAMQTALTEIDESNDRAMGSVIDFSNDAIEYVANATKSEASQSFDKLVKVSGYAVGAIAAATLLPRLLAAL
jgi:hypothetical protein